MDARHQTRVGRLCRAFEREPACRGAGLHSSRTCAQPNGQRLREGMPRGSGPRRRRPLRPEGYSCPASRSQGRAYGASGGCGRAPYLASGRGGAVVVVVQPAAIQPLPGRMAVGAPADTPTTPGSVVVTPSAGAPEAAPETPLPSAPVAMPRPAEAKMPREAKEPPRERPHLRSTSGTRAVVDIFTNPLGRN